MATSSITAAQAAFYASRIESARNFDLPLEGADAGISLRLRGVRAADFMLVYGLASAPEDRRPHILAERADFLVEHVIGWSGLMEPHLMGNAGASNVAIPYHADIARQWLCGERSDILVSIVQALVANYAERLQRREAIAGNSLPSSTTPTPAPTQERPA